MREKVLKAWEYLRNLPRAYQIGGAIVLAVLVLIGTQALMRGPVTPAAAPQTTHVHAATVRDLSSASAPLSVIGTVTSLNQATILAETSGQVTSLTTYIGATVGAGQVIGSFENASQQAAVTQARGAYDAALAAQSATSLPNAAAAARNAYLSAYTTLDTALYADIDTFFGAPTPFGPQLLIDSPLTDPTIFSEHRRELGNLMETWRGGTRAVDSTDPAILLSQAQSTAQAFSLFVTDLARAANNSNSQATSAQLSSLATARSSIDGALASLASANSAYRSGSVGATSGASAGVMQAQGVLDAAHAALSKTVIRSPISGTIVSLPIHLGDFVSAFSPVAVVSNPQALEVKAYVTADDAKTLSVGAVATVGSGVQGRIASIAPALDPMNGKILVKIDIDTPGALTDGESTTVFLARSATTTPQTVQTTIIPLAAVKITPQGPVVFTVASSTLSAQSVTLGTILGDRVVIASGVTPDTQIVTDARGLSSGETVIVDTP